MARTAVFRLNFLIEIFWARPGLKLESSGTGIDEHRRRKNGIQAATALNRNGSVLVPVLHGAGDSDRAGRCALLAAQPRPRCTDHAACSLCLLRRFLDRAGAAL